MNIQMEKISVKNMNQLLMLLRILKEVYQEGMYLVPTRQHIQIINKN